MGRKEDMEELSLELSIGGKYGKAENLRETSDFVDFPLLAAEKGCETIDPRRRREIQSLRRQEARRKRVKKSGDDKLFLEAQKFQARARDREIRENDYCFFEGKNELGLSLFTRTRTRTQTQTQRLDCDSEYSNEVKSLDQCSSAVSDHHTISHKGGSSTTSDTGQVDSHDSSSQAETDRGLGVPQPSWMRSAKVSNADDRRNVNSMTEALSKDTSSPSPSPSAARMPCVSTTGNGPNGRTVTGFLYRYNKMEVSIICVCHGTSFSPAEFVAHAGGVHVTHPLRHITVVP